MVKVLKPGMYSSVQDFGRFGCQEFGVPYSGVMDRYAAKIVNLLLGNDEKDAVIEMTMTGASFQFESDACICVSGAEMSPKLNEIAISNNKLVAVKKDDILSFGRLKVGFRSYLGVVGGFKTESIMQSRSMYHGITSSHVLKKGDMLPIEKTVHDSLHTHASIKVDKEYLKTETVEVFKGPEFNLLTKAQQNRLLNFKFTISKENNRMAYQLVEPFKNNLKPIVTSAVIPGTVQLTPSGKLIVLMRDCQTTGGYPRVLQLTENAINALAQKYTSQNIQFKNL